MRWLTVILRACGSGLAVAILLAPAPAAAQEDPGRASIKLGPITLKPRLTFSDIGVDNNVFNEPTAPKRDFTFTATPIVEVSTHPGRLLAAYTSRSDFVYFKKYKEERSLDRSFSARVDVDFGLLKPFASISSGHTSARPSSEIDVRARHHPRVYMGGVKMKIASRTSVGFLASRSLEEYDDGLEFRGVDLAKAFDSHTTVYETSFGIDLTPFTTLTLTGGKEQQRFDRDPIRNSDSIRIAPALVFSPLGLVTGNASVGYRRFKGVDPALPDYSGLVATGGVAAVISGRYNLSTIFTRDVRYSYEESLPYYLLTAFRGTLAVQFVGPLDVRVLGGRETMSYRALAGGSTLGDDKQVIYGSGLGYRLAERFRMVVEIQTIHRTSVRDPSREYRNNRVVAFLNWGAINQ